MEPGGSMPHSQGLSNNPYPELNQPNLDVTASATASRRESVTSEHGTPSRKIS